MLCLEEELKKANPVTDNSGYISELDLFKVGLTIFQKD